MNRRHLIVVIVTIAVALASCQRNSLRIKGNVINLPDGAMKVSLLDTSMHWSAVDSFDVEKGQIKYESGLCLDDEECIILSTWNQNLIIFTGNANITINGNALRPEEIEVKGSESNDDLIKFAQKLPGKDRLSQIEAALGTRPIDNGEKEKMLAELRNLKDAQIKYIREQILLRKDTPLGAFLLFNHINLFSTKELLEFSSSFSKAKPHHKYVILLNRLITERMHRETGQSSGRSNETPS